MRCFPSGFYIAVSGLCGNTGAANASRFPSDARLVKIFMRRAGSIAVRCVDVAALIAAAILRKNPSAEILPFDYDVTSARDGFSLVQRVEISSAYRLEPMIMINW
jgi:hypothetical protein